MDKWGDRGVFEGRDDDTVGPEKPYSWDKWYWLRCTFSIKEEK